MRDEVKIPIDSPRITFFRAATAEAAEKTPAAAPAARTSRTPAGVEIEYAASACAGDGPKPSILWNAQRPFGRIGEDAYTGGVGVEHRIGSGWMCRIEHERRTVRYCNVVGTNVDGLARSQSDLLAERYLAGHRAFHASRLRSQA